MPSDVKPILLVDSDSKSRRVLEVSLRKAGYEVVGADSAASALAALEAQSFGLVIFDTTLKDADGYDFCAHAKSAEGLGQIPFIALSQSHDMANKLRGFELGVDDYIAKPVYLKEVVSRTKLLLERRGKEQLVEAEGEQVTGDLVDFSVVDILQTLEEGQKTGALRLERDTDRITIFFDQGRPVDANAGSVSAEEAVYRALSWEDGEYTIKYLPAVRRPRTIDGTFNDLVVEGLQRSEQMDQLVGDLGSFGTVLKVDYSRISDMADNMPPEVDEIVGLIDGRRNVGTVVSDSSLGDLESVQVIKRLSDTGVLAPVGAAEDEEDDFERLSWESTEETAPKTDLVTWLTGDFEAVFPPPMIGANKRQKKEQETARKAAEQARRLEMERIAEEEAERKAREEAEREAREEVERKAREEEERLRNELNELFELKKSEEEALRRAEEERRAAEKRARELEEREQQIVRRLTGEHATVPETAQTTVQEVADQAVEAALAEARAAQPSEVDRDAALEEERIAALEEERVAALEEERRRAIESAKAAERARLEESVDEPEPEEAKPAVQPLQAPKSPVLGPSGTIRVTLPEEPDVPPPIPADEVAPPEDDVEPAAAAEAEAVADPEPSVDEEVEPDDLPEDDAPAEGESDDFDGFFKRDETDLFSALYPEGQEDTTSSNRKPLIIASIITLLLAVVLIVTFNNNGGTDTTTPVDEPEDELVDDDDEETGETAAVDDSADEEAVQEPAEPTEEELMAARLDAVESGANFVELALRQSELEASTFGTEEDFAAFELVDGAPQPEEAVSAVASDDEEEDDARERRRDRDDEEEDDDDRQARVDDDEEDAPDVSRHLTRGRRHYERGNYGEATAELRQVIEADPRNAEALDLLGRSLYENGDTREAVQMLERATRANRRNAELLLWLGSAKVDSGDTAGARESFERFLELNPDGDQADEIRRILEEL